MPGVTPPNVPNPPSAPSDLPDGPAIDTVLKAYPTLQRIITQSVVGPTDTNRQHRALEKRTYALAVIVKQLADAIRLVDSRYLRRRTNETQTAEGIAEPTTAGALGPLSLNNHQIVALAAGTQPTHGINLSQLSALQAELDALEILVGDHRDEWITALANEVNARVAADAALQAQIDAITGAVNPSGSWTQTSVGSHVFTAPSGVFKVNALLVGAGGTGGRGTRYNNRGGGGGGGGGGGAVLLSNIPVVPGQTYTATVGAKSTSSPEAPGAGGNGNIGVSGASPTAGTRGGTGGSSTMFGATAEGGLGGYSGNYDNGSEFGGSFGDGGDSMHKGSPGSSGQAGGGGNGGAGGLPALAALIPLLTGLTPSAGATHGSAPGAGNAGLYGGGGSGSEDGGHGEVGRGGYGGDGLVHVWWG